MIPERPSLELFELLAAWCDGTLDHAGRRRLEECLASDAAARQCYIEYLDMHARLYWDRRSPALAASFITAFDTQDENRASICCPRADEVKPFNTKERTGTILSLARRVSLFGIGAGIAAIALLALAVAWGMHRDGNSGAGRALARRTPPDNVAPSAPVAESAAPAVAELSRLAEVRWTDSHCSLAAGEKLCAGQILRLAGGVAEIRFDIGVRMVVQAPAVLVIELAKSARLERGKVSAEITTLAARGFQIKTSESTFVDQGTEFGVEVSPDGNSRVHVFKGEVDVEQVTASGRPAAPHRLLASGEAWLEKESQSMTLLEDTGDSFIRSVEQYQQWGSGRDRHVIAYWRFEDRPLGVVIPNTRGNSRSSRATLDSSFNGNDLFAYGDQTHPDMSDDVPASAVYNGNWPGSREPNRGCLDNSQPPAHNSRDLYTHSAFSHAFPQDIQAITPEQWTIEASIKPAQLKAGAQTFIGRDGNDPHAAVVVPSRLVFQIDSKDHIKIGYFDIQERWHQAVAEEVALQTDHWYHVAATSDGKTLKLYVDELDGRGYRLAAATELPRPASGYPGSTALGKGTEGAEWSLGRGKIKNHVSENFRGWIDEVRISDVARDPTEFVFAEAGDVPAQ